MAAAASSPPPPPSGSGGDKGQGHRKPARSAIQGYLIQGDSDDESLDVDDTLDCPCKECIKRLLNTGANDCEPGPKGSCSSCRQRRAACV